MLVLGPCCLSPVAMLDRAPLTNEIPSRQVENQMKGYFAKTNVTLAYKFPFKPVVPPKCTFGNSSCSVTWGM